MKIGNIIKSLCVRSCVFFALITFFYSLLTLITHVTEDEVLLPAAQLVFILLFSVLAAIAGWVLRLKAVALPLRVIAHFALLALAFYLCFLLPLSMPGGQVMVGMFGFALVYAVVMGAVALFRFLFRKNAAKAEETTYQKQFKKKG